MDFDGRPLPRDAAAVAGRSSARWWRAGSSRSAATRLDLHRGILGNPQGNLQPAGTTRAVAPGRRSGTRTRRPTAGASRPTSSGTPRSSAATSGKRAARDRLALRPLQRHDPRRRRAARDDGRAHARRRREQPRDTPTLRRCAGCSWSAACARGTSTREIAARDAGPVRQDRPQKIVHVDLDYVYDADPAQQERNLGAPARPPARSSA